MRTFPLRAILPAVLGAAFLTLPSTGAAAAAAKSKAKAAAKPEKTAVAEKAPEKAAEKSAPPPAASSPMAELKKSNDKLDKILRKDSPSWSVQEELKRDEVRKLVGSFLDYGELAKRGESS